MLSSCSLFYFIIQFLFWYGGVLAQMSKLLQIAQNKVIRFILGKDARYHITDDDYKALNFFNIHNRAKQHRLNHVFDVFNERGPEYLRSHFTRVSNVHQYGTRKQCAKISKFPSPPPLYQAHFIIMPFGIGTVYLVKQNQLQTNNSRNL